jgi:predicted RNase H-like nuclease/ppGpp synthetase/RelA/SpoT-type nucleotidyltranferase
MRQGVHMHFVGLDLAWGTRQPTGVAVLDDDGRLLTVGAVRTDDEVVAALGEYVAGPCVVAVDAPLVVTNPTGNRPCEAALNRDFARFDAGAHPSNTGKPEFGDVPRGARLAERLGLDLDPTRPFTAADRRAIEVYPHAATVALFRLGRTLKYKNKPGRTLPQLRSALLDLMRRLEGLADAPAPLRLVQHEAWRELVTKVEQAERKSDLRKVEDQVDAVVCAYVALFAVRRPELTTTYGDADTGAIVTPTLPPGHKPSPRAPRAHPVQRAVQAYAALQPALQEATEEYVALVTGLLDDAGINYLSVDGRTKSIASFAAKADRVLDGKPVYPEPLEQITDQIGVRVITYLHPDVTAVADLLADQLRVLDDRDMGQETASEGRWGYASRHLLVTVPPDAVPDDYPAALHGRTAQVQVRTALQHAWAEFEHDIRYKGTVPEEHAPDLDRRFTLAAGLIELADNEFTTIRNLLQSSMTVSSELAVAESAAPEEPADPRISGQDLAAFLAGQYADAGWSRTDHYVWISGLLLELGITSLDELAVLLSTVDHGAIDSRMGYKYPAGAVRRLDDALLAVFGERYIRLHGNAHRQELLRARLAKMTTPPEPPETD